ADRGDPFIIRSYSPMTTIGGGRILDPLPARHRRFRVAALEHLHALEQDQEAGGASAFVRQKLRELNIADRARLIKETRLGPEQLAEILDQLIGGGIVERLGESYLEKDLLLFWEAKLVETLARYHRQNPLSPGVSRARLRGELPTVIAQREYDALLARLAAAEKITAQGQLVSLFGYSPQPAGEDEGKINRLVEAYRQGGLQPPAAREALTSTGLDGRRQEELFGYLTGTGALVKLNEELYLHAAAYRSAEALLLQHFETADTLTLAQFRDVTGSSRRLIQPLLEHFDRRKLTRRVEDHRILLPRRPPAKGSEDLTGCW
ncbi:MAG: SelB C-terminal domain-containing protein, partial [Bacillota bacterium]